MSFVGGERAKNQAIRFALSLKRTDGKRAYYNLDEQKVSRADSKAHDKRWEEVPEWADGSVSSAFRILRERKGHDQVLRDFTCYEAIRKVASDDDLNTGELTGVYLKLHEERPEYWKLQEEARVDLQAFEALSEVMESYHRHNRAQWALDVYRRNTAPKVETPAEEAQQAA